MSFLYPQPHWFNTLNTAKLEPLPKAVRQKLGEVLGSPIKNETPINGGYSPKPSYFVTLEDGRECFIKGEAINATERSNHLFSLEVLGYRELTRLEPYRPAYLTDFDIEGQVFLVIYKVKNSEPPMPWNQEKLEALFKTFHGIYAAYSTKDELPDWIENARDSNQGGIGDLYRGMRVWANLALSENHAAKKFYMKDLTFAFQDSSVAQKWFEKALPFLIDEEKRTGEIEGFSNLLHFDLRQDNLLFRRELNGRLTGLLLDWGHLYWGPVALDIVRLIKNIYSESGCDPEANLALFTKITGVSFEERDVRVSLAALSGQMSLALVECFDSKSARCNWVQRLQAIAGLQWWAKSHNLPAPPPLAPMPRPSQNKPVYVPEGRSSDT